MNKTADSSEILRLRKELIHSRTQIADLQEELEEKTNLYMNAIRDRDQYKERLNNAKESINRVENIVQSKVNLAMEKERIELAKLREENQLFRQRIELFDQERDQSQQREKQLMEKIQGLTQDLAFYARNVDARDSMKRMEALRDERDAKERHITELTSEINKLSNRCEDLLAETRTLRKMANVPANYGINLEQVKLYDREKIDDFKKLIRVLQEDNYRLEEERARLKHMLKQQSMLYKQQPSQRYNDLTQEQIFKVDQYVMKLKSGDTEEPADYYKLKKENQNLKAQLEALNSKGFEFVKNQIEFFFKEHGLGDSNKALEKLLTDNEELRRMIRDLLTKGINMPMMGGSTGTGQVDYGKLSRFRPPVPQPGLDGDIHSGYSYKYETHLEVFDKNGRPGIGEVDRHDVAFLQLQLQEALELIKKKDENLAGQQNEIDILYKRVRDYLLIQDQLYKDYVKMEKEFNFKKDDVEKQLRIARDTILEEQTKLQKQEDLIKTLQVGNKNTIEARLIELTKQNSIIEINLLRLTRKYQTLEEQEALLRRDYHNKEADMAEKDIFIQERINKLKEWKARAIQQLKFLFGKLRMAIPLTEYQAVQSELDIYKHKNADLIDRNSKMASKMTKLQTQVRENMEAQDKVRQLTEMKDDAENELEVLKRRLENVDQNFKWETAVFNKIVAILKRYRVSPQQAFEEFDKNKDGKLQRDEFIKALEMMKISDLSLQEVDMLMLSLDVDSDGSIQYKEFLRKLSRHGVRNRTSEEQIVLLIIEALKKANMNMSEAFEITDKEKKGTITRDDFKDIFKSLKLNGKIQESEIDKFIDHFWKDKVGGIDYLEFLRIFNRYQVRLDEDEKRKKGIVVRIPDDIIRMKKKIFEAMDKAFKASKKSLRTLFSKVDANQSNEIDIIEFTSMFERMDLLKNFTKDEIQQIFNSVDFDLSGKITYPEFSADFYHFLNTDINTLLREEKEKANMDNNGSGQQTSNYNPDDFKKTLPNAQRNNEIQLQSRVAILESREKQLARRLETAMRITNHAESAQHEIQRSYDELVQNWSRLTENCIEQKERIKELEDDLRKSIRKEEAEHIKDLNEKLSTELTETKAAMLSYKNMTEVIADQAKGLKLIIERKKDENENLINALRELQSQSIDQQRLGKLYYVVMLSRWQEAAANKKYDMILSENKEMRRELLNSKTAYENLEYDYHESENTLQDVQLRLEKLKQRIASTQNIFLTIEKAEQLNNVIQEITDEKTNLEENYFKIRSEFYSTLLRMDEAEIKADSAQVLLDTLQNSKQSELSDKLIEVSEKIRTFKLEKLRSERESTELKEKNNYLQRLMKTQIDSLKKLEEQVSEFESRMHKREEEFRRADNERMKRFFNARFDDIPGALQGANEFSDRKNVFRESGYSPARKTYQSQRSGGESNSSHVPPQRQTSNAAFYEQPSRVNQETDQKLLENKCKKLQEELKNATDMIRQKESIINRFKEWQLTDKYLSQDENLKQAIEQSQAKSSALQEQETKEMADAALQTIKTLQEMLDQKNQQMKSKEEQIEKLRKQIVAQREQDAIMISKLQQDNTMAASNTLNKLQEIVIHHEAAGGQGGKRNSKYERLTREELQKAVDEKDNIIQQLSIKMKGLEEEKGHLNRLKEDYKHKLQDAEHQVEQEKKQTELKASRHELDRVKKELKEKQLLNDNLKKAIDDLNLKMVEYEKAKSNLTEDKNTIQLVTGSNVKKLQNEVEDYKGRLKLMESARNQKNEQLKQIKINEQEKEQEFKKILLEKDNFQKQFEQYKTRLDNVLREKEKIQIELNALRQTIQIGRDVNQGISYEALLMRNKELENDIVILECQKKTVVVYNKESGTFEYIGDPIFLNKDAEVIDIDEMLTRLRSWLGRNERLTFKSIFEHLDPQNFGELTEQKLLLVFQKIGVKLRNKEIALLKDFLDPKKIGFIKYRPLVRELLGIPQSDFMIREVLKIAKLVEARDLDRVQFQQLFDPTRLESMDITAFRKTFTQTYSENFQMTESEVDTIFKYVTKTINPTGVRLSMSMFTDKVFNALDAILIEKMKDSVVKSLRPLSELFAKYDSNKDGFIDLTEFESLLLECQVAFQKNLMSRVQSILDPTKKTKISYESLKFFIQDGYSSSVANQLAKSLDYEPSLEKVGLSEETTNEEVNICKSGARKLLSACQNNLQEILTAKDKHREGVVSREDIQRVIEEQKIADLQPAEINILMKYADRTNKGYVAIDNFVNRISELAVETKQDAMLRRFANTLKHQSVNLKQELLKFDVARAGRMEKKIFNRAMKQLTIALTDDEIEMLFSAGELPDQRTFLDIKTFCDKVQIALKAKPLPTFLAQAPKTLSATSKIQSKGQAPAFDNWEAEKKYKKKLEALQQQIEESKKETQAAEKQSKHWQEMSNKLEKEKNSLQARLVDLNAKPPKAAMYESLSQGQLEQMQAFKDQVFYLQEENNKLERTIQVQFKAELSRIQREKEKVEEKNKQLLDQNRHLENQVNRLIGKPMDQIAQREEQELWREKKIQELLIQIEQKAREEKDAQDQLFQAEERLLDLRFEKENFDLQYARLQKRITDLEQYKLASSKYSAVLKNKEDSDKKHIEDNSALLNTQTNKDVTKKDSNKLRERSSKSVLELETVIESLKRVIEKQTTEIENYKKQLNQGEKLKDKLKSEKQLRQKIETLELEVHSYEMKDVNLEGKDKNIKKLLEANKDLREKLMGEVERYNLLETKYKDVLVKYNVISRENQKNLENLFSMNTGGNIHNYEDYLSKNDDDFITGVPKRSTINPFENGAKKQSFNDRNFEDLF